MLITFRGRKSGKLFTTPIGYMRQGDRVSSFTDHRWWRNLVEHPEVTLRIQGKRYQGTASLITLTGILATYKASQTIRA